MKFKKISVGNRLKRKATNSAKQLVYQSIWKEKAPKGKKRS